MSAKLNKSIAHGFQIKQMEADKVNIKINISVHDVPEKTEGCEIIVLTLKPLSIDSVVRLAFSNPRFYI